MLPLALPLEALKPPPNNYHHAASAAMRPDAHARLLPLIREMAAENGNTYGSPHMWLALRSRGVLVPEKVVRRLMKEEHIEERHDKRKRKHSSYVGEITPAVDNRVAGVFRAEESNRLRPTDVTELAAADRKAYLSPMIDHPEPGFGPGVEDTRGRVSTLGAAEREALRQGGLRATLVIHTNRRGHYRGWRQRRPRRLLRAD